MKIPKDEWELHDLVLRRPMSEYLPVLNKRFAFAGEVKLTRDEAILLQNVLWRQGETGLAQLIESKITVTEVEGE